MRSPHVLQLIMDSLRYWVTEMHVDGFRFDLAATLARQFHEVDRLSRVLRPRPAGPGRVAGQADRRAVGRRRRRLPGRQLPAAVDRVERQVPRHRPRLLARRAAHRWPSSPPGSPAPATCTQDSGRRPIASINFVTAHDGFTLRDLVSYNDKHNEANGEGNSDGESHNRSWNCGVEGPTPTTRRSSRCAAGSSATSWPRCCSRQGVPMLLHGDEIGRTQQGNNNAYCQDNELSWVDWSLVETNARPARRSPAMLAQLRRDHPVFRRRRFFRARRPRRPTSLHDIAWFTPTVSSMDDEDWDTGYARSLAVFLNGDAIPEPGPRGQPVVDDSFLLLFNALRVGPRLHRAARASAASAGSCEFDTAENPNRKSANQRRVTAGKSMSVEGRSAVLLRRLA